MIVYYEIRSNDAKPQKHSAYSIAMKDFEIRAEKNEAGLQLVENIQFWHNFRLKKVTNVLKENTPKRKIGF